jgi:hypothetical protein
LSGAFRGADFTENFLTQKIGEEIMALDKSKLIPTAFWVGFLALGFVTSVGGPNRHRVVDQAMARPTRTAILPDAVVAETEPPAVGEAVKPAQD